MNSHFSPPGKGSGTQLEEGSGIGQTRPPSASPLPLVLFSIPATSELPLPGTDKVQLEAGTSCDCAHPPQHPTPTQTSADSCTPGPPPWNPYPALAWLASKRGGRVEPQTLLPWQPSTPPRRKRGGKRGPVGGSLVALLVAQERATEAYPVGLLGGHSSHCPLPLQSQRVSKPVSPRFSPGSPHSPKLTQPPLGDGPGQTPLGPRSSPEVQLDSEAHLGGMLVAADPHHGS